MAASFPGLIKTFTPVVNGNTIQTTDINDPYDEITAMQSYTIGGFSRGGPLDRYMTTDPGFSSAFGVGATRIVYDAVNDRLTVTPQSGDAISGVYLTLPTALQVTPSPTAIVRFHVEFVLEEFDQIFSTANIYAGFMNHANPATAFLGALLYANSGGAPTECAGVIAGSGGMSLNQASAPTEDVRYRLDIAWQDGRPLALRAGMYNATTGAEVAAAAWSAVGGATNRDAALPDLGVWFDGTTADNNIILHIYDMWAQVVRL